MGSVLLLFVVLLNRRTVWLTLLVGVAVVMLRERRLGPRATMLVAIAALVTVALYVAFPEAAAGNRAGRAVGHWHRHPRVAHPRMVLPVRQLVDGPGALARRPALRKRVHPDGLWDRGGGRAAQLLLLTLLRMGLVGMLSLIALTGGVLRALWRIPTRGGGLLEPGLFPALLTMQLIWFITWIPGLEQGIVTGLAVGLAAGGVRRGHLAFPHAGRWTTRERPPAARPSRSPAGDGMDPAGTSNSAGERR